ncbi:DUF5983 family protein [Lelliottia wanjuensis]|uniref:DUF5983 family protein n=1 Tax=Lelliottia wanjuensis TaxID=3050585 RepID=A0AAP4FXG1_9ENTR|nr:MULTISPECIES: DUF5983 family protein [unclassified Lelliottia]MDK9365465.1 DUF5983 family protein [Lelliottia sp. V106_12]MDK9587276.1 DUF5983 family protein [Lelliottia sp. V86_10]MDK9615375.1 DUF5983 family protein [Lelliottia sp. V106_9]
MKISVNIEAGALAAMPLNGDRIAVDMDGIELATLVDAVNTHGTLLRIADQPGQIVVEDSLPFGTQLNGLCCSTAHITSEDNALLHALSQQSEAYGDAEWVHYTGSGYLLRLDAWSFPVLRLKRLGLSKACRRLVVTLQRRYALSLIHFDAFGELLPGFDVFDW